MRRSGARDGGTVTGISIANQFRLPYYKSNPTSTILALGVFLQL